MNFNTAPPDRSLKIIADIQSLNARSYEHACSIIQSFDEGKIHRQLLLHEQCLISLATTRDDILTASIRNLSTKELLIILNEEEKRALVDLKSRRAECITTGDA